MINILQSPSKRFLWRLYLWFVIVIIGSFLALSFYSTNVMRRRFVAQTESDLLEMSKMVEESLHPYLADPIILESKVKALGEKGGIRITIIDRSGVVLADSEQDPAKMDNHIGRPEVHDAISGLPSHAIRYSDTLHKEMMYVAAPVFSNQRLDHVVRVSKPQAEIFHLITTQNNTFLAITMVIACSAVFLSFIAYKRTIVPLRNLKDAALQFARGEFGLRLSTTESRDMQELFDAMNQMAEQLDSRIKTILQQAHEQDAVLESMIEGVIAISNDEKVLKANSALIGFLEGTIADFHGRSVVEVVRSVELQKFIRESLKSDTAIEEELTLIGVKERKVRACARPMLDGESKKIGVLVVLHDVTRLRKLENIRRDFVANVSHELRTPITSIKGSVDTLLEGAMEDPSASRKFLEMIARHSDRLIKIVDDLLGLARIEAGKAAQSIVFEEVNLLDVVSSALQICEQKSMEKSMSITVSGFDVDTKIKGNVILLEQAVVNLLSNAIDYSDPASKIFIRNEPGLDEVVLHVQDFGCGIPSEHFPRLFERFYRVDRARSRKQGGTGLGLSIVKHIAQLHGGRVSVQSQVGQGSTFSICLPRVF